MEPIIVSSTLRVAGAILVEAALSYLGLGIQPTVMSFNAVGDGLRDALDPRLKH